MICSACEFVHDCSCAVILLNDYLTVLTTFRYHREYYGVIKGILCSLGCVLIHPSGLSFECRAHLAPRCNPSAFFTVPRSHNTFSDCFLSFD